MPRAKRGNKRMLGRKKIMSLAKGFVGGKHRLYRTAKEAVARALNYAYRDRRAKKREFRSLWIIRINAATREHGLSYSRFMSGLQKAGVNLDRKMLAELAVHHPGTFAELVSVAKQA